MSLKINPDEVAKLQRALEDDAFADSLIAMQKAEDIQAALKGKDINLSIDEIVSIGEEARAKNSEGEVDENELEDVAGGYIITPIYGRSGIGPIGLGLAQYLAKFLKKK